MEEDIEGLKILFYSNALTQYGKRKLIGYYEQQIKELKENRIPVSLVEEIKNELHDNYINSNGDNFLKLEHQLEILERLLEKRK